MAKKTLKDALGSSNVLRTGKKEKLIPAASSRGPVDGQAVYALLTPDQITVVSNYRKSFSEAALQELAESIKIHGILQPLVIRVTDQQVYQLVSGERRYRAAALAGLEQIPCMLRKLTDKEFYEVQILENLQRQDVDPMEEAAGFQELLKQNFTTEEISLKIGKGTKYVAQRLRLNSLSEYWKEKLAAERINLSGALEIAKLPENSQTRLQGKFYGNFHSKAEINRAIQEYVFLDLEEVAFPKDDTSLLKGADSCTWCTKRTGCNKYLFEELAENDRCLDPVCFDKKSEAYLERQLSKAKEEGRELIRVAISYSPNSSVLRNWQYEIVQDESEPGIYKDAIIVDGVSTGKVVRIKLEREDITEELIDPEEAKAARLELIRNNKIRNKLQHLCADEIYMCIREDMDSFHTIPHQILDHYISHNICWGGMSKATRQWLMDEYEWSEYAPTDEDWKYSSRWAEENLSRMSAHKKLELYFCDKIRKQIGDGFTWTITMAEKFPERISVEELRKEAEEAINTPKKKNKVLHQD